MGRTTAQAPVLLLAFDPLAQAQAFLSTQVFRENARSSSGLKHRELNHTAVNLATRKSGASDTLELCSMLLEIAERLALRPECRLKTAHLPNGAYRQYEGDCLPAARLSLRHDPRTFGHVAVSCAQDRALVCPPASYRYISKSLLALPLCGFR
jgi:hypothetical protein